MPSHIISDRDRIFTSTFWWELFKLAKTSLCMSSAYHPQSDGQTERVNQCIETYMRCFVHSCPRQWSRWISLAEFWYNTSLHSSLGRSLFEVMYNHLPHHFGLSPKSATSVPELDSWMAERAVMNTPLCQHLLRAQQHMKTQADDKWRSERSFNIGNFVFLRLQHMSIFTSTPCTKQASSTSAPTRSSTKLELWHIRWNFRLAHLCCIPYFMCPYWSQPSHSPPRYHHWSFLILVMHFKCLNRCWDAVCIPEVTS